MAITSLRSALRTDFSSSHFLRRLYSSDSVPERKVAILGAAGGIGQPLSLLMKINPLVSTLAVYDVAGTPGVAADVSHVNTVSKVHPLWFLCIGFSLAWLKNGSLVFLSLGFFFCCFTLSVFFSRSVRSVLF